MRRYAVIIEQGPTSWGAHVPDLPVCFATGATREEVRARIEEGIRLYLDSLRSDGMDAPAARTFVEVVEVAA
jgi:predicted RNase H-like HicB family nuclease